MTVRDREIQDAEFFAWLDEELVGDAAARVEKRVAEDPELQALAKAHRALGADLGSAFEPLASAPVPSPIVRLLEDRQQVISLRPTARAFSLKPWFALAATLVVGVMLGRLTLGTSSVQDTDSLFAPTALEQTLDTQLASAPTSSAQHVGITFRNDQGGICRSFQDRASSGVACREAERWRLVALFPNEPAQSREYRMAGSDPRVSDVIESMIDGAPFDARQEARARASGWR